jgi:hypothetical protein
MVAANSVQKARCVQERRIAVADEPEAYVQVLLLEKIEAALTPAQLPLS